MIRYINCGGCGRSLHFSHYKLTLHYWELAANQFTIPRCRLRLFSLGGGDVKIGIAKKERQYEYYSIMLVTCGLISTRLGLRASSELQKLKYRLLKSRSSRYHGCCFGESTSTLMNDAAIVRIPHRNTHVLLIAAERRRLSASNMLINADLGIALKAPGFLGRPCQ